MDFQENNFEKSNLVMTPNSDNFGFVQKAAVVRTVSHKLVSLCNVMLLNSHCLRLFLFFPIWLFHIILLFLRDDIKETFNVDLDVNQII